MLAKLPHRFVAGEVADPIGLNESFGYVAALINGNLDANNLAKTARLTAGTGMTPYNYTPSALTFYLDNDSAGAPVTAEYQFHDLGSDVVLLSHAEFSLIDDNTTNSRYDGRSYQLGPIVEANAIVLTVAVNGVTMWRTTYDVTVPARCYVWPYGQQVNNENQRFVANEVITFTLAAGASTAAQFVVARVWLLWPQVPMPANSPKTDSLTRELMPPELI